MPLPPHHIQRVPLARYPHPADLFEGFQGLGPLRRLTVYIHREGTGSICACATHSLRHIVCIRLARILLSPLFLRVCPSTMYFRFATIVALLSAPLFALAAQPNPFKIPQGGLSATAGTPLDLAWTPTTTGTVSLVLRSGESTDLKKGVTIACTRRNTIA
jgi:hypothetical protein